MSDASSLENAVRVLERRTRLLQIGLGVALVPWLIAANRMIDAHSTADILRARGIILEDTDGKPRMLLGVPAPKVAERVRTDPMDGIVLLGEDGRDRLQLGNVGGPQMGGVVQKRIASATGIQVNDEKGEERGGFGLLGNGRMVVGLDSKDGEGVMLFVAPDLGMNGLMINGKGREDSVGRVSLLVDKDQNALLRVSDVAGSPRLEVGCEVSDPCLRELDSKGTVTQDLLAGEAASKK